VKQEICRPSETPADNALPAADVAWVNAEPAVAGEDTGMSNDAGVKQEICRPSEAPADKIDPATDVAESIALPTG